jgi:outer membrane receptor protein involved in Fe transport
LNVRSERNGAFVVPQIPAGKYRLYCRAMDYELYQQDIEVVDGRQLQQTIILPPVQFNLEDLVNIVIITATKTEKKPDDIASMVDVLTAQQIKQRGYRTLADVLNDIPNNHQDRGNWGIGEPLSQNVGFGFRFDTGQNMLLLFNGQRLNAFLPGNRFGGEEYLMDNVERIEIVRGPGSALYGANAFTLVVNIITKQRLENNERSYITARPFTLLAPSSSGAGYGAHLSFATELGSTFISGGVQGLTDPGQNINVKNSLFGDAVLQDRIRHAFTGDVLLRHGEFRLFAKFSHQVRNTFTGFNGISPTNDATLTDKLSLQMYNYSVGADYHLALSPALDLKLSAGWHQDNWTEVGLIPVFKVNASGSDLVYNSLGLPVLDTVAVRRNGRMVRTSFPIDGQGGDSRTLEGEAQLTWNIAPTSILIAGVNMIEDRVVAAERPTEIQLAPALQFGEFARLTDNANNWLFDTQASRLTLGIYAQADYAITPELSINAGARLDIYSGTGILTEQRYSEFSPRGGIVYKHQDAGIFKCTYGRAMRVPSGFEALSSVTILGNPSLRPERLEMAQIVWIKNWGAVLRTELGGFIASIANRLLTDAAITGQLKAQGFIGQFINVPQNVFQRSNGIDAKILLRFAAADVMLNATQYIGTDNGGGQQLQYIPTTLINANVNVPIEWCNVNVGAQYRSQFTQPLDDIRSPVPAYLLTTLALTGKPFSIPLEFQMGARNVLNSSISAPSSSRDFPEHFRGRQLEFWLSFAYRFE